jgi:hypothetical protein
MSNNNNNEDRARIIREARATLDRKPAPYQYVAPPRMLGDDIEEPFEPAPAFEQRQAQTQADPWAGWEAWLETRLNAALAFQWQELVEIVAHVIANERERAAEAMHEQVRGMRDDLTRAEAALEQLRKLVEIERHKVLDLPALPARRDFN